MIQYCYIPIRMAKIKNVTAQTLTGKDVKKFDHSCTAGENEKW